MTKQIEVTIDALGFRRIETFIDELSGELNIENTYYGNILASLAHLFEYAGNIEMERLILSFESGHDGLVFDANFIGGDGLALDLTDESKILISHLTDNFKLDEGKKAVQLFFDTKSVFNLMANKRAEHLKEYLRSSKKSTKTFNDSLQRG